MNRIKALAATLLIAAPVLAQTPNYVPGITQNGVTYCLPRTCLKITVISSRVSRTPGDFKDYAARYLRLNNVTTEPTTEWKIDKIHIATYGAADTSKIYTIPLRKKTVAPLMSLTDDGILLSINTESTPEPIAEIPAVNTIEKSTLNPRDFMSEEILVAGNTSKMAELTAAEIYDIRDSRSQLAKGQADNMPKDGEQLKLMIRQLDTQEAALMQLFAGTEERETRTQTLTYIPTADTERDILFRFSTEYGLVDKNNLSGEPVYISIADQKTVPAEVDAGNKGKKPEPEAVRYNVPSTVAVKIFDRQQNYIAITAPMGQFGHVENLSSELFNKRLTTRVTFYSTTGALKKLSDSPLATE